MRAEAPRRRLLHLAARCGSRSGSGGASSRIGRPKRRSHEWTRSKDGKLQHRVVTPEQAELLHRAIANHREIQALVARWEEETASEILSPETGDGEK